jgi:hypothetical protein
MGMCGVLTFMDRSTTVITIYQLRRPVDPFSGTNPRFPEDYRPTYNVETHCPSEAFYATNQDWPLPSSVRRINPNSPFRSASVGDIMVIDRCVGLLVESVGFSYQFDLRNEDMASGDKEIQSLMNSFHFYKGATK